MTTPIPDRGVTPGPGVAGPPTMHELALAPKVAADLVPLIQFPALVGEGALCLWLLVVGVDVERWKQWATRPIPAQSHQPEALR